MINLFELTYKNIRLEYMEYFMYTISLHFGTEYILYFSANALLIYNSIVEIKSKKHEWLRSMKNKNKQAPNLHETVLFDTQK